MPSSMLFGVNTEGRVFGLSTNGKNWREFPYLGLDFKQLSAVPNFLWAVGSDSQIYVHVHGLDIPIRVKEEAFENQRWYPIEGFSTRLLPTDRHQFSSEDGLSERTLEKIRVPSMAWQWDGPWKIETVLNGEPLDHDGWTYAIDFPATYYPKEGWNLCVRRRKWVRRRKYCAMNSWCAVSPLHHDPTKEPFIHVSVGGQSMVDTSDSSLLVWAVTAQGRVMLRKDVSYICPEGTRWIEVPKPKGCDVKSISCGATGLVWAILWSGKVLVRLGVTTLCPLGESWAEIDPPDNLKLHQISVGSNSVWTVSSDKKVWFRKGVKGDSNASAELAKGTGWVEMIGNMSMVSVTSDDQVFAVGIDDRSLYFRVGVCASELTGKRWRILQAAVQISRASSINSNFFRHHNSSLSLHSSHGSEERCDWLESSKSVPTSLKIKPDWQKPLPSSLPAEGTIEEPTFINNNRTNESGNENSRKLKAWSPIRSVGSLVGFEANPETDPNAEWDGVVYPERETVCEPGWSQADTLWSCVEAGALSINLEHLPHWFVDLNSSSSFEMAPWRAKILNGLKELHNKTTNGYESIEVAIEMTSCVKSVLGRCCLSGEDSYDECCIQLEWIGNKASTVDTSSISVFSPDKTVTKCQFSMSEVVCLASCSEPGCPKIAVYTFDTTMKEVSPLKLQFNSDTDLDDWMAHLSSIHAKLANIEGPPSASTIWATTQLCDVYVFDHLNFQRQQAVGDLFRKELPCRGHEIPWQHMLNNGFPPDSSLMLSGFIPENSERFSVNLDIVSEATTALHFNPRFRDKIVVRNTFEDDKWGSEEREGFLTLTPGGDFTILIFCQNDGFKISLNGMVFTYFMHRLEPHNITHVRVVGDVELHKVVYSSKEVIVPLNEMIWKQMGGHLATVETCALGVTWGISADNTPYAYSGGWGGMFLGGLQQSNFGINQQTDAYCCYVYENQRWNPLNGFTARGLPTDRPSWSDSTGHHKRSKESTRLLSMHWQWVSDWSVDFRTPGGVDSEGWQYSVDFSMSYHAQKTMTDYVRRRRWARKCKLTTSGPWIEVGNTKIIDVSLQVSTGREAICVWAIGYNGDALFRKNVTTSNTMGDSWEHILCDQPLISISCGCGNQVWAVTRNGSSYWRFGITTSNPQGEFWETVEPPKGSMIKKVTVARWAVWALDEEGKLFVRREVTPVFPEGTHWQPISQPNFDFRFQNLDTFRDVSASGDEVWAVLTSGAICRRTGVSCDNPAGTSWIKGLSANWQSISIRSYTSKTLPRNR